MWSTVGRRLISTGISLGKASTRGLRSSGVWLLNLLAAASRVSIRAAHAVASWVRHRAQVLRTGACIRTKSAREHLRELGVRGAASALLAPAAGFLLLGFAAWTARRVLPVAGAPETPPPIVTALPPDVGFHTTSNGYVISLTLSVMSCSKPVIGDATIVLPQEYFNVNAESQGLTSLRKALFAVAVDDPSVRFKYVLPADWRDNPLHRAYRNWDTSFANPSLVAATGTAATVRLDDWNSHPQAIETQFTADWLSQRGYGSCWLRLPRLMGEDEPDLAVNASDAINGSVGPVSGASDTGMSSSGSSTIVIRGPDGRFHTTHTVQKLETDYVGSTVPASIGYVTLSSPLTIIPGESEGPAPQVGVPHWSCTSPKGVNEDHLFHWGVDANGQFEYLTPATLGEFATATLPDCSAVVALAEPGSQSGHDLWLLVIGAALSTGAALLVEAFIRRPRQETKTPLDAVEKKPSERSTPAE